MNGPRHYSFITDQWELRVTEQCMDIASLMPRTQETILHFNLEMQPKAIKDRL